MTMDQVDELFAYWRESPPTHELIALELGYEAPKTADQQIQEGAMGPEDFLAYSKKTGGKVDGLGLAGMPQ